MSSNTKAHRGRLQAQGGGVEESVKWEQDDPPKKNDLLRMLDELWNKLNFSEQKKRKGCFDDARRFINSLTGSVVLTAVFKKTFQNRKLRGGIRVDIEVLAGEAGGP